MARYIDADALKRSRIECQSSLMRFELSNAFVTLVDSIPTADVVPVVRCKDCKHRDPEDYRCDCGCWHMPYITKDEDFCSYGVRRGDE